MMSRQWKFILVGLLIICISALIPLLSGGGATADCSTDADGNTVCDAANPPTGDVGGGPGDQQITVVDVPVGDVGGDGEVPGGTNLETSAGDGGNDTITIQNADVNGNVSGDFVDGDGGQDNITIDDQTTVNGTVSGDWAGGDGNNDQLTVDGTVTQSVLGDAADGNGGDDTLNINGDVDGFVAGDFVETTGGDDIIEIGTDGNVGQQVLGDWAGDNGGADTIVIDGTVTDYVAGDAVEQDGGADNITVNGSVGDDIRGDQTQFGDGNTDTIQVSPDGTVGGAIYGDWAVTGNGAADTINVEGLVSVSVIGDAVAGDGADDTITITGAVLGNVIGDQSNGDGGNDTITIEGAVLGDVLGDHSDGVTGEDSISISGTVEGDVYADNGPLKGDPAEGGNDIVEIVEGATVAGIIDGGPGNDTLSFTFSDLPPDDAAFIQSVIDAANANPGIPGSLNYNNQSYNWQNFENFLSLITQIVVSSGGTVDLSGVDTTPGTETPNAPGGDGRLCNWPNAAVYTSLDGIFVYGIDGNGQGSLATHMTAAEISQFAAVPGSNIMLTSSGDLFYRIYMISTGDYQVNVGPDGNGIERYVIFDHLVPGTVVCGQFSVNDPSTGNVTGRMLN